MSFIDLIIAENSRAFFPSFCGKGGGSCYLEGFDVNQFVDVSQQKIVVVVVLE